MKVFDVYPRNEITPVKGEGCYILDEKGIKYLDMYGGHAVISIGHSHPHYIDRLTNQLSHLGYYSNSVQMPIQDQLADKLGEISGYPNHHLFLCNSGAESIENALKLASFHTGREKIVVFKHAFHGRTSLSIAASDYDKYVAPINHSHHVVRVPLNDLTTVEQALDDQVAAVLIEGIQGLAGIYEPTPSFLRSLKDLCGSNGSLFILDEVQSGYGRSGKFFAHQYDQVVPDIICVAKGMGNGFPIGGVMISPQIEAWPGMLGSTFGGNHLACAAGLAVLEVMESEELILNAANMGAILATELNSMNQIKEVRGKGLMIGIECTHEAKTIRERLLHDHHIFTGTSSNKQTLRLLPPLSIGTPEIDQFLKAFKQVIQ